MFCGLNEKVKKLTVIDISLVKLSVFFFSIIAVKLSPGLLKLSYPALTILILVCGAKPFYNVWFKK